MSTQNETLDLASAQSPALILIRDAMASDVAPEKLRALLEVKQAWEADEARKAFSRAITEFQKHAPIVEKGDDANGKKYAALDRIWRTVRPLLTDLGLSVTWQVSEMRDNGTNCHLEGMLRHRDGHGEKLSFDLPIPDAIMSSSGRAVQNKAQVMGSANTYAKRYALCAALGIVTGEDSDGTAPDPFIGDEDAKAVATLLDACRGLADFDEKKFWQWAAMRCGVPVTSPANITVSALPDVLARLNQKLGKRA